jgi:tetratricopeptide (TPR) repeat protein
MGLDALGYLYLDLNLLDRAMEAFSKGIELSVQAKLNFWRSRLQANLAIARLRAGRLDVQVELDAALELAQRGNANFHAVRCLEGLAELALARRQPAQAIAQANSLLAMAEHGGQRENTARAHYWRGEALRVMSDLHKAESDLLKALTIAESIQRVRLVCDVHRSLAQLYQSRGEHKRVVQHAAEARAIVTQIESGIADAALRAGLAQLRSAA